MKFKQLLFVAMGVVCFGFAGGKTASAAENTDVTQQVTLNITKEDGFTHPGISVEPGQLEKTRECLASGENPWTSYYEAMTKSDYAKTAFSSKNLKEGTVDTPDVAAFNSRGVLDKLLDDSYRAYTQALMYFFTGNEVYRANAIRTLRIWSQIDGTQCTYFADAHIHSGWPIYYLTSTAELIKYTSTKDTQYDYGDGTETDLIWSDADSEKLSANVLKPALTTFLDKNDRYLNQQNYTNVGRLSAEIFMNDKKGYADTLEWITVNKDTDKPFINGAIKYLCQWISKDDPRNSTRKDFVQLIEMGRDAAHAWDDVATLSLLSRISATQDTKVDPATGEISDKSDAVDLYQFSDKAILRGSEQFYEYTYGNSVPWVQLSQDGGEQYPAVEANGTDKIIDYGKGIANYFRGRTVNMASFSELYDMYRFKLGMSADEMEQAAPSITKAAKSLNSPIYYNGTTKYNFWDVTKDLTPEYWVSIPEDRSKEEELAIKSSEPQQSTVSFSKGATILDSSLASVKEDENGEKYVSIKSVKEAKEIKETGYDSKYPADTKTLRGGNQVVMPNISLTTGDQYVALKIRTNGEANLLVSGGNQGGNYHNPYLSVSLPDTKNQWKYIVYNRGADKIDTNARKSNEMDFYAVTSDSDTVVDMSTFDYVNVDSGLEMAIPAINEKNNQTVHLWQGVSFRKALKVDDPQNYQYALSNAPKGMSISDKGVITWTPDSKQKTEVTVIISSGDFIFTRKINFDVSANQQEALENALSEYQKADYTSAARQIFEQEKAKAEKSVGSAEFLQDLTSLEDAISNLQLLTPTLDSDGSLNYNFYKGMVTLSWDKANENETIDTTTLTDDDLETYDANTTSKYLTFDFGEGYGIKASAFGFEARTGFPNRIQGENVYGSNDGINWDKLTTSETKLDNNMQKINVSEQYKNQSYRYLKVQADDPGPDTDPAYPGINTRGEFHIFGQRVENDAQTEPAAISVSSITLKATGIQVVKAGKTLDLAPAVTPEDAADKAVAYTFSKDGIVTVDDKGVLTAVKPGMVKVTAKAGDKTAVVTVRVTQ